jgi:fructokinase
MNNFNSTSSNVTFIGEVLVDYIEDAHKIQKRYFGGSPANIAMNLSRMGFTKIHLFGAIGNDEDGAFIQSNLVKQGLSLTNIQIVRGKTSRVTINQTSGTPIPSFDRYADYQIVFNDRLEEAIKKSSILHFSYWPLSVSPARETVLKAIDIAKKNNVMIAFDPNFHEALSQDSKSDIAFILSLLNMIDFMKPSLDDAVRLFGKGFAPREYLEKFVALGVTNVVLSLGKDGLIAQLGDDFIKLPSTAINVVDATGAGDAFYSGFYAGMLNGEQIDVSLLLGLQCSALALQVVGAQVPIRSYEQLRKQIGGLKA